MPELKYIEGYPEYMHALMDKVHQTYGSIESTILPKR